MNVMRKIKGIMLAMDLWSGEEERGQMPCSDVSSKYIWSIVCKNELKQQIEREAKGRTWEPFLDTSLRIRILFEFWREDVRQFKARMWLGYVSRLLLWFLFKTEYKETGIAQGDLLCGIKLQYSGWEVVVAWIKIIEVETYKSGHALDIYFWIYIGGRVFMTF